MNKTNAVEIIIQAVSPESIVGVGESWAWAAPANRSVRRKQKHNDIVLVMSGGFTDIPRFNGGGTAVLRIVTAALKFQE